MDPEVKSIKTKERSQKMSSISFYFMPKFISRKNKYPCFICIFNDMIGLILESPYSDVLSILAVISETLCLAIREFLFRKYISVDMYVGGK